MALFEELSQHFSLVEVEPYGRVLVVPSKAFRQEWLPQLEGESVKVYSGAHDGQACFFLKAVSGEGCVSESGEMVKSVKWLKTPHTAEKVQEPSQPLSLENASMLPASWTKEETEALLKLRSEGLTFEEIGKRLGKTEGACYAKWARLAKKQQPKPKLEVERQPAEKQEADAVRELIDALNMLYPKHRKVCMFLLKHASEVIGSEP